MSDNEPQVQADTASESSPGDDTVDSSRMSLGDHLDELRHRLILAILGAAVGAVVSLLFAKELLSIILQPLMVVLRVHGLPMEVQSLGPPDTFMIYLKVGLLAGVVLTFPWVLWQLWLFIASGLYEREQLFVKRFAPVSTLLFFAGVAFMYIVVLPIILNFFVGFNKSIPLPDSEPTQLQKWILSITSTKIPDTQPAAEFGSLPIIPILFDDPTDPPLGSLWYNDRTKELNLQTADGVIHKSFAPGAPVSSRFGLNFYVSLVLMLALAFGLAFEVPVVVVFLVLLRLVSVRMLRASRRYVILGMLVAAAILTPPDVISQVLLAVPMLFLFEAGLLVGQSIESHRNDS